MAFASVRLRPRRLLVAVGLLLLLGLVGSGCGTSVKQRNTRYADQLQGANQVFVTSVQSILTSAGPAPTSAGAAAAMGRYEAALARVETRLRSIHAPATVSPLHRHLIKTIDRYGAEVRRAVATLRVSDRARLSASAQRFQRATQTVRADVTATVARIKARLGGPTGTGRQ